MRLSICIPTYNRANYISRLLDSILGQADYTCQLEIVISDNASTDDTESVVNQFKQNMPFITYEKAVANLGADRNFLRVIELATGNYCWLMGDDDILEPEAIRRIETALLNHQNIAGLSVNRHAYTSDLGKRLIERPVAGGAVNSDVTLNGAETIFSDLAEYLCFISAQVVDRELWLSVADSEDLSPYLNSYIHVYIIGRMLQMRPTWVYIAYPCVGWRSGNDSFMADGAYKRMMIDIEGMDVITAALFGKKSKAYRRVNTTTGSVQVRYGVLGAKLGNHSSKFLMAATPELFRRYWRYPQFWVNTVPVLLTPSLFLRTMRWLYRKIKR